MEEAIITTLTQLYAVVIASCLWISMFLDALRPLKLSYTVCFSYRRRSTGAKTWHCGGTSKGCWSDYGSDYQNILISIVGCVRESARDDSRLFLGTKIKSWHVRVAFSSSWQARIQLLDLRVACFLSIDSFMHLQTSTPICFGNKSASVVMWSSSTVAVFHIWLALESRPLFAGNLTAICSEWSTRYDALETPNLIKYIDNLTNLIRWLGCCVFNTL